MSNKDALFEEILSVWVEALKMGPDLNMDAFLERYDISCEDKKEIRSILELVEPIQKLCDVKTTNEYENKMLSKMNIYFNQLYVNRPEKIHSNSVVENLFQKGLKYQFSFRNKKDEMPKEDKQLIDEFVKELKGSNDNDKSKI